MGKRIKKWSGREVLYLGAVFLIRYVYMSNHDFICGRYLFAWAEESALLIVLLRKKR